MLFTRVSTITVRAGDSWSITRLSLCDKNNWKPSAHKFRQWHEIMRWKIMVLDYKHWFLAAKHAIEMFRKMKNSAGHMPVIHICISLKSMNLFRSDRLDLLASLITSYLINWMLHYVLMAFMEEVSLTLGCNGYML